MSFHSGCMKPNEKSYVSKGSQIAVITPDKKLDKSSNKEENRYENLIHLRPVSEYLLSPEKIDPNASITERMELIGSDWANRIRGLFPELAELERAEAEGRAQWVTRIGKKSEPPLPEVAPSLWAKDKLPGDTPPDFIQRHYGQWFDKGFTQAYLRRLDPQGEMALRNWRKKNADPEWFHLQTKHESLAQRYSTPPSPETIENLRAAWRETRRYKRGNRGQTEL